MKSFVESYFQATMTDTFILTRERWIHEWKIGRRTVINRTRIRNEDKYEKCGTRSTVVPSAHA